MSLIKKGGGGGKALNTLTSTLLPHQPSLLFPILILFTSLLCTPLLLAHLCFSFFHLISYFFRLSVRSNQLLCGLSLQKPTVCLLLDQPFRRFFLPSETASLLLSLAIFSVHIHSEAARVTRSLLPCYFSPLLKPFSLFAHLWMTFSLLNCHLKAQKCGPLLSLPLKLAFLVCKLR